jgi:CRP-like cAMP-binding protein
MEIDKTYLLSELRDSPVFDTLSDSELAQLGGVIWHKKIQKGELLFELEKSPRYLFYVMDGEMELTLVDDTVKLIKKGDFIGEIGLLHGEFRTGIVRAKEETDLITICGTRLFEAEHVSPAIALKIVRVLARRIVGYLQNREQSSTLSLIQNGENDQVEFKSTFRLNLHSNEFDKRIELACLKTIAAFLNTSGGTLLIGVADSGELLGLEHDRFKTDDKRLLHLTSLVKTSMGELSNQYINAHHVEVDGQDVLRIDCRPSLSAVYLNWQNEEKFYIRSGPSTADLGLSSVYTYIKSRFVGSGLPN